MREVVVHLPTVSGDVVSDWLVALTKRITEVTGEETGYGLGGRYGYGENFENDVFMMHRYCWCERSDCEWCRCCNCTADEECGAGCASNLPAAPNFLHKASGASVRWYKYIGRGMEVDVANWPAVFEDCFASLAGQEVPDGGR